jgi:large subunit ribosomal protein L29
MATKKFIELQGMASDALTSELTQVQSDLNRMKFDHQSRGIENPNQIGALRKEVARFKTELRSREIKELSPEALAKRSKMRLRRK